MVYFLSDVHLGYGTLEQTRQRESLLIAVLEAITPRASQLFLVGDVFDYWFEYHTVLPRQFYRTLAALDRMRSHGIAIEYIVGNHDFGHRDFFERELGITVHWRDIERTLGGKRFYIAHGDGKVAGDWGYIVLRTLLRSRLANRFYRWIHPDIGIKLAALSSRKSRSYTSERDDCTRDSLADFARRVICDRSYDYVIMGHRHRPMVVEFSCSHHRGTYINLGDWLSSPRVAVFDGVGCSLVDATSLIHS